MKHTHLLAAFSGFVAVMLMSAQAAQDAVRTSPSANAAAGVLTGSVSNTATRNLLEGARVEVPALGIAALTDNTGRFVITGVPAGTHEVVASYIGLDPSRAQVTVTAGQRAVRDFDLSTGIYTLDAFKVTGEREGDAAASRHSGTPTTLRTSWRWIPSAISPT